MYTERRHQLVRRMRDAVAIFFAAPETIRNNDVHHDYRQDSDLYYLTGFEEPECVLVVAPHRDAGDRVVLFLREKDPEREVWDGKRLGVDDAAATLGVDRAWPITALEEKLPEYLHGATRLYHALGRPGRERDDRLILAALATARRARRKGIDTPGDLLDPEPLIHELRLVKDDAALAAMKKAAALTARGHRRAMAVTRAGLREYQLRAALEYAWGVRGSMRNAYQTIVGSGPNACVLHYRAGDRELLPGELVLVDAGCEVDYHAADVTRTWPVDGRFTEPQRAIYALVLKAQKAAIDHCRPGRTFESVHDLTVKVLVEGLVELGLLDGKVDKLIEDETFKRFYMHRTSHWLGMDVHDVGGYHLRGTSRSLEPGMVLTIEPGLYIAPDDDTVDAKWRGIGIRIEDDIHVTDGAPEILTAEIPKEIDEIEAIVGTEKLAV
ncbi:MAG: Xaa-Pro aminopeptidase [Myxococcales bacterium]|nr:Xaa-Pro aminopeptidase [Myxococcales bacterium]